MASMRFIGPGVETVVMDRDVVAAVVEVTDTADVVDSEVMDVDEDEVMLVAEPVAVAQTNPKPLHSMLSHSPRRLGTCLHAWGFLLACFAASMAKRCVTALHVL
jgi:hypothetical protein